ncbi:MAG: UDP-N-acetylmuramoyl-L-alanine--D-glutamate ligase, partial [Oscillospiraceae bacterium]|nr:UDP-N-acetylmuramoyl-L-alanine--D-glutamate ligase [Oscillospiraceae bacterium]
PHVAVITNISPNHLDKHLDYQDYIDAKMSIFREQTASDRLVLFADDAQTPYYASKAKSSISFFTDHPDFLQQKQIRDIPCHSATVCRNGEIMRSIWNNAALPAPELDSSSFESILPASDVKIPGEHNVRNYLAAIEAVRGYVSAETCRKVAMSFCGVHHRLETIRTRNGVTWINDSIASSPTRAIAGVKAVPSRPIVIAGGYDKHLPFDSFGDVLNQYAKALILTGNTAEKIRAAVLGSRDYNGLPIYMEPDLPAAVRQADLLAGEGDIVMLSPACASFDQYRNFEVRGDHFRTLVQALP